MKLTLPINPDDSIGASADVPILTAPRINDTQAVTLDRAPSRDCGDQSLRDFAEYLLVCDAHSTSLCDGRWRFALETADGTPVFDAEDIETGDLNRLTLLAAVRGLESIEGPSLVTLLSNNRYLIRSLSDSLPRWRQNDFIWEHFGRRIDVQNADLWRRVDRALSIHRVEACLVSSRLVSAGPFADQSDSGITRRRIDSSRKSSVVPAPKFLRQPAAQVSDNPLVDADTAEIDDVSGDRLRRWLMGASGNSTVVQKHRFTPKDLHEDDDGESESLRSSSVPAFNSPGSSLVSASHP